jgi:hypothetical protein
MAKLARKIGGGLDAVIAMTGHKDLKLADHYSKSNEQDQKEFSERIMKHIRTHNKQENQQNARTDFDKSDDIKDFDNVISLFDKKSGT